MHRIGQLALIALLAITYCKDAPAATQEQPKPTAAKLAHWPHWRGPHDTGVSEDAQPPLEWSETKNIRWKIALPGLGHGTPVIWGDRVFVTAAVSFGDPAKPSHGDVKGAHDNLAEVAPQKFFVLAINRKDGKILWQRQVHEGMPYEGGHFTGSQASASPVTDGKHLIASFGSQGLYGLDLDGKLLWSVDLGILHTKHAHGEGASPVLHGDTVIVNCDHEGESFVVALDKRNGKERWRVARPEVTSWSTPIVVVDAGKPQVIVSGTTRARAYDLASGKVVWECGGMSHNVVASPVASKDMVYLASSYEKQSLLALRFTGAKGDLTVSDHLIWMRRRKTPYVPSPLLYGDRLYLLHHYQGRLSIVDARTGEEPRGPYRLPGIGNIYASPVGAAGRVYITDLRGSTLVIEHGDRFRPLAFNKLDDSFNASAALAGKEIYLRGEKFLYCIAKSSRP